MATIRYRYKPSEFLKAMEGVSKSMAVAAHGAVTEAGKTAVLVGDSHVTAKGFPRGFRVRVRPRRPSLNVSATITHRRGYLGVFEHGGPIRASGGKLMWLPIEANNRRKLSPRKFSERFGRLSSVNRGSRPLLVANVRGETKPVFVGVDVVNIRDQLDFTQIVDRIATGLFELYNKHLKF